MTDIIIQGIYGRMGRALVEKIGAREDCRIVAGVDREAGRIGEIPVYAGFDALPCKGVIIDFPHLPGRLQQRSTVPPTVCPASSAPPAFPGRMRLHWRLPAPGRRSSAAQTCRWVSTC